MCATLRTTLKEREKIFASEKEIYLLCHVSSSRPEDNKAGFSERMRKRRRIEEDLLLYSIL